MAGRASHPGLTPAEDGCTGLHARVAYTSVWAARWAAREKQAHERGAGLRRSASYVTSVTVSAYMEYITAALSVIPAHLVILMIYTFAFDSGFCSR